MKKVLLALAILILPQISSAVVVTIRMWKKVEWIKWTRTCKSPGNWICADVDIEMDVADPFAFSTVDIDYENKKGTLTLDLAQDNNFFMQFLTSDGRFNFAEDLYLRANIVQQSCGVYQEILLKAGTYNYYRNGDRITMLIPFEELQ